VRGYDSIHPPKGAVFFSPPAQPKREKVFVFVFVLVFVLVLFFVFFLVFVLAMFTIGKMARPYPAWPGYPMLWFAMVC